MTGPAPEGRTAPAADGAARAASDAPPVEAVSPRKAILLALVVAACVAVVYMTPLRDVVSSIRDPEKSAWIHELRARADEAGWVGWLAFVAACALAVGVGVPRLAVAFAGGALYGWVEGAILSQIGTFLGCWGTFEVGRHLGRAWVQSLVARRFPRAKTLLDFISRHGFEANVLFRMTPVGNAFATNLLFAVSTVRSSTFLVSTAVGTAPETALAALAGSAAKGTEMAGRLIGATAGMAVLAVAAWWWTRRLRARRAR